MIGIDDVILITILSIIMSIFIHEKGHSETASKLNFKVRENFYWQTWKVWNWRWTVSIEGSPTRDEETKIIMNGILWGLIPIVIAFLVVGWWGFLALLLYVWGVRSDVKKLREVLRGGTSRDFSGFKEE